MRAPPPDDPAALDGWLATREAAVPALRAGQAARIVWAGRPGQVTRLSLVYLHGFSAGPLELSPLPERLAAELGANLFLPRLTGHGQDGPALGRATLPEWRADVREALQIGATIGERTVALGTSTGGTLLAIALGRGADLAGAVFLAPNFAIGRGWKPRLLEAPLARLWVPWILGPHRSFEAASPAHAANWTLHYPSRAVVPVAQAVRAARALRYEAIRTPAFFAFTAHDEVVDPAATRRVIDRWGGPTTADELTMGPGDDPRGHVVAGDAMSPGQTDGLVARLAEWVRGLGGKPPSGGGPAD
ncbi:alpha/beta hydrolase [Wenxinia marina]|uniref:Wenxma_12, whole genome shotgun sequence n=1 Tax=Wenxinia marina DSM 24838 TaxID=1123501 RepID=A0A0D0PAH2_9RHOB|nr:alpha/beta hydrolase [Wenxinia marina]KIQ68496.1 Alpha/beta hydrolase family [Wenxinia marina DSM 24838]GGL66241.1 lysophospholipase [Wenxinia marina]